MVSMAIDPNCPVATAHFQGAPCICQRDEPIIKRCVLITGSRKWRDVSTIARALADLSPDDTIIVHGHCPTGADAFANSIAETRGFEIKRYPAKWSAYGAFDAEAGFKRNVQMYDENEISLVLAFPLGKSPGTRHCMSVGTERHITVRNYGD